METQLRYTYLEHHPDKGTQELFIRGTGWRTSTIWHDRYASRMTPQQIAQNRDLPFEYVARALPSLAARRTEAEQQSRSRMDILTKRGCLTYTRQVCTIWGMKGGISIMRKRVNITLPEETVALIDRVTEHGDRSRFIDEAVKHYVEQRGRSNLRKQLQEGAIQRAQRDLALAEEWFALDEEPWQGDRR